MRSVRLRPPSPAMAVALLALFVALGGSSYAALKIGSTQIVNNSVRSKDLRNNDVRSGDVRNNSLTGRDVNEARLGTVPSANTANSAGTTGTAANADALGGVAPDGFVRTPTEPVRLVDTPGNPAFENGNTNNLLGASVGFFKDQFGVVHIQGDVNPTGSANTIFTLPEGYRPDQNGAQGPVFVVATDTGTGVVSVDSNGSVRVLNAFDNHVSLNGITFRATH